MTEKELQLRLGKYLSKFFDVFYEIWDTTNKFRIDLVLIHKSDIEKKYPIGIEIKINEKKKGKDLANWLKQSNNYSSLDFKSFGKCLIIVFPQITFDYLNEGNKMNKHDFDCSMFFHNNINTFLGQYKIGEIFNYKNVKEEKHILFVYSGSKIWDSEYNELNINNILKVWK